jgi:hypothetical protein
MSNAEESVSWVVYQIGTREKTAGLNAVCEQSEWDAMELARPGYHTIIRGGIPHEAEAERMARGTSGDTRQSGRTKKGP